MELAPLGGLLRGSSRAASRKRRAARSKASFPAACSAARSAKCAARSASPAPRKCTATASGSTCWADERARARRPMMIADGRRRYLRHDDVADAAVAGLDDLVSVAQAGADEAVLARRRNRLAGPRLHARRFGHDRDGKGRPAHATTSRIRRASPESAASRRLTTSLELDAPVRGARARRARAPRGATDSRPTPARMISAAASSSAGTSMASASCRASRRSSGPTGTLSRLGAHGPARADLDQERAALGLLVPVGGDEQDAAAPRAGASARRAGSRCRRRPTGRRR